MLITYKYFRAYVRFLHSDSLVFHDVDKPYSVDRCPLKIMCIYCALHYLPFIVCQCVLFLMSVQLFLDSNTNPYCVRLILSDLYKGGLSSPK